MIGPIKIFNNYQKVNSLILWKFEIQMIKKDKFSVLKPEPVVYFPKVFQVHQICTQKKAEFVRAENERALQFC